MTFHSTKAPFAMAFTKTRRRYKASVVLWAWQDDAPRGASASSFLGFPHPATANVRMSDSGIEARTLTWRGYPGLSKWIQSNRTLKPEQLCWLQSEGKMWPGKNGQRNETLLVLKTEEEGHEPWNVGGLQELEKARRPVHPESPPRELPTPCSYVVQ